MKWRNIELDVNVAVDDPEWRELLLWSNETLEEEPLLTSVSPDRSDLQSPQVDQQDEETSKVCDAIISEIG